MDYPLSDVGRRQASRWQPTLSAADIGVRTSPLSRAAETAAAAGHPEAERDARLLEWDLGSLEGLDAERFRGEHPAWNLFIDGPPEGSGESTADVRERARTVVDAVQNDSRHLIALVSHGQFLRALVTEFLGLPLADARALSLGPARAGIVTRRGSRWSMTGWNVLPSEGLFDDLT